MVSIAAFDPGNSVANPGWFAVINSKKKLSFKNSTSMWYSNKYCYPAMGDTLVGGDK